MSEKTYEHPLDPIILSVAPKDWDNITGVMNRVFEYSGFNKDDYTAADIAERIYILVDNGQLDVKGNMRRWRTGKVKAKS